MLDVSRASKAALLSAKGEDIRSRNISRIFDRLCGIPDLQRRGSMREGAQYIVSTSSVLPHCLNRRLHQPLQRELRPLNFPPRFSQHRM